MPTTTIHQPDPPSLVDAPFEEVSAWISGLLRAHRASEAVALAQAATHRFPDSASAWRLLAAAFCQVGNLDRSAAAIERAIRLDPEQPLSHVVLADIAHKRNHVAQSIEILESVTSRWGATCSEAWVALTRVLMIAGEWSRLSDAIDRSGLADSPQLAWVRGRLIARSDPAAAIDLWMGVVDDVSYPMGLRWSLGFEAVRLLDKQKRYHEAFELAQRLHSGAAARPDVDALDADVQEQVRLIARLRAERGARQPSNELLGIGFVAGLPRSGTTLLEQMLDQHPAMVGIGEYEGLDLVRGQLTSRGLWPGRLQELSNESIRDLARHYIMGALARRPRKAQWVLDKSVTTWRSVPAVATLLPGAAVIHIARDPRDAAISMFLSPLNPASLGWNQDLSLIRRVIGMERSLMPAALEAFGLPHVSVPYEALVRHPRGAVMSILKLLQLPWDEAVLSPEKSNKVAITLSNEQVRKPISDSSIGRWKNYAFAFDSSWDGLAAAHAWRVDNESARLAALESQSEPGR
jgi:tetratricopeptide (TPR) repeat protein